VTQYPGPVLPIPAVPWRLTGNHWLAVPCIHPVDGSIHALGMLHRGARAAIEFAGGADFVAGGGPALLRPAVRIDGEAFAVGSEPLAWDQSVEWVPSFSTTVRDGMFAVRGTIFAPAGRDADVPGVIYVLSIANQTRAPARVELSVEGTLGHRQQRVRTPSAFADAHRVVAGAGDTVLLDGSAVPGPAALAIGADGVPVVECDTDGPAPRFALRCAGDIAAGGTFEAAFYVAAAPERDGAAATVQAMRRRGWRALLASTVEALRSLEQTTGNAALDRVVNRNLLFAYFYAVGRAVDDARFYLVRTRAPWNGRGVTVRDWDALTWTVPAVQLADAALARELILRACEVHGAAPGSGIHYMDGALFEPGFSLEGVAAFAWATERYIRETGDDQIVEEPVLADTLYASADDLAARRHAEIPLYGSEVYPSGAPVPYPYTLHGNAVAALALDVFRRTLDAETAKEIQDPSAVRAAILRHFTTDADGKSVLAAAADLRGNVDRHDDPVASVLWLPLYETLDRQESVYRRTVKASAANQETPSLVQWCARLVGPDAASALAWLREAPLDNGVAAELLDADGAAVGNGGDASLSGLLAYSVWYAVHALGAGAAA
jgi:hypothetical protein